MWNLNVKGNEFAPDVRFPLNSIKFEMSYYFFFFKIIIIIGQFHFLSLKFGACMILVPQFSSALF